MKTNGEWVFDEQMVTLLGIDIQNFVTLYGKTSKAMTAGVLTYLKITYP